MKPTFQCARRPVLAVWLFFAVAVAGLPAAAAFAQEPPRGYAEIRVIDSETGRGVPLVELETVNNLRFVTDNAGRVAFNEPGLLGTEVFFFVRSHGYEFLKDGFGMQGVRLTPRAGETAEIKIQRVNIAERMCRLTGQGLYRDTRLLGMDPPENVPCNGLVSGQDSVQAAVYKDKVFWIWGDTSRLKYPLGLFRAAGATTPIPDPNDESSDPAGGIPFNYFVDETGFARAMIPIADRPEGVVWIFGMCTVKDATGAEKLIAHYSRRASLAEELEQGICVFNDKLQIFEPVKQLPPDETWRRPRGNPVIFEEDGHQWLLIGSPAMNVRVPATLEAVLDPQQYEALTCAATNPQRGLPEVQQAPNGRANWRWQKELPPMDSRTELQLVRAGKLDGKDTRFCPKDVDNESKRVILHSGTVRWNEYRQRWVMLAGQVEGESSYLGEVWYAEADHPSGPFAQAVKVVTHDQYSFYNVRHQEFLDRDGGRSIHFEGTYSHTFSGNSVQTPRYDYNQVLYRLDLDDEQLNGARLNAVGDN